MKTLPNKSVDRTAHLRRVRHPVRLTLAAETRMTKQLPLVLLLVVFSGLATGATNRVETISVIRQRIAALESGTTKDFTNELVGIRASVEGIIWKPDATALEGLLLLSQCDLLAGNPRKAWGRRREAESFLRTAGDPNVEGRVLQYGYRLACLLDDYYWSLRPSVRQRRRAILDGHNWCAVVRVNDEYDPLLIDVAQTFSRVAKSTVDDGAQADAGRRLDRIRNEFKWDSQSARPDRPMRADHGPMADAR